MLNFLKNTVLPFIGENWLDILIAIVGLSAFIVYFMQKRDQRRVAATLIVGQIKTIEKRVSALKDDHSLGNIAVYRSKIILKENTWEKYNHLFVKGLNSSEYEIVQQFFDDAEQIERARKDIVTIIAKAWSDKSAIKHQIVGELLKENEDDVFEKIENFKITYDPMDLVFTPDIVIQALVKKINNYCSLTGTTAFQKLLKYSFNK